MTDEYFVPTRSSRVLGTPAHEVVVHTAEKGDDSKPAKQKKREKDNSFDELDMKNARFEIYKFAQTGLKNVDKQKNQKELAVKLGAVPPKRKHVNYKVYKDEVKKLKEKEKEAADLSKLGYIHRPVRSYKQSGRNPKAKLHKKMELGTGILKKYGTGNPIQRQEGKIFIKHKSDADPQSVWSKFLTAPDEQTVQCKNRDCNKVLETIGGSTNGLLAHLAPNHKQ